MIKTLSFIGSAFISAAVFGYVHPESSERPSLTSEFNTALEACTTYVEDDPIVEALNKLFGPVKSCSREQDREGDVDFGEIISVAWDGADYLREARPPESAIMEVQFASSALVTREWFSVNRDKLVPADLGIDWTTDIAAEQNIEQYVSSDPSFNGKIQIVSNMEGKLMSFRLSYAL